MRRIAPMLVLVTMSLGLVGCARWRGETIDFTVVDEGDTASDYPDRQGMCVDSLSKWRSLWEQLHRYTIPQPVLPEIDFTQYMLIAVFAGEKKSGSYSVQVQQVRETKQALIVHTVVKSPDPDQVVIAQIIYPYQIVKIPRSGLPVNFRFDSQ